MTRAETSSRSSRRRTILWVSAGLFGVLVIAAVSWTGFRAVQVKAELDAATGFAKELQVHVEAGDLAEAERSADGLADHAKAAARLSDDPVWRAVEFVPIAGENLRAVRIASSGLDALSEGAIAPGLRLTADLASVWSDGALDLAVLSRASQTLTGALDVVRAARDDLDSLDMSALLGPVRQAVEQLDGYLAEAEPTLRDAGRAAGTIPAVLGQDGPRSILVMLQNGAELRTGGGLTGSFAELSADRGVIEIVDQASSADFPELDESIITLPDSVSTLFDGSIGRFVQNISSPTDFDVSAQLASEWWEMRSGHRPDTILSIDVRVLSAVLAVVGPVGVGEWGDLTSDNLVDRLLVDPYMELSQREQDSLFQRAVREVFTQTLAARIDPVALVDELTAPIEEGRISLWSSDPKVQSVVAQTTFAGSRARQVQAGDDAFAVYLNDVTGAKMDTFLDVAINTDVRSCRADGRRDVTVAVTLANTAPADAGRIFPDSVTAGGHWGVPPGDIGTLVAVSAPPGTFIGGVRTDGELVSSFTGQVDEFPVTQSRIDISPGQSETLEFDFIAFEAGEVEPRILHTPLLTSPEITQSASPCA